MPDVLASGPDNHSGLFDRSGLSTRSGLFDRSGLSTRSGLKSLRAELRAARRQLSGTQQRLAAHSISRYLQCDPVYQRASRLGIYLANDGEANPSTAFFGPSKVPKNLYLPLLSDALRPWEPTRLLFQSFDPAHSTLIKNRYGIDEPAYAASAAIPAAMLDIVLVPLVGFDRNGNRLGMGKGYYDRTFANARIRWRRPKLLGIAHSLQEVAQLPSATWDVPLDGIVTERGLIWWR
ncbi:MAG: 5-formyltetrahydrofolate cyclo-ligase [Candidatus Pseudothioglobus sp.]|jgi:5-formyltetrahydrofolate cyclo-ligase